MSIPKRRVWHGFIAALLLVMVVSGCSNNNQSMSSEDSVVSNAASYEAISNMADDDAGAGESNEDMSKGQQKQTDTAGQKGANNEPVVSGGGFDASAAMGLNRKLIYTANYVLQVENYGKAQSSIRDLVSLSGGYIVQFTEGTSGYERGGNFTIKVPASGFSSFLKGLDRIETVRDPEVNVKGQDVSEEYVDLESRLKAKQMIEARYLVFIEQAAKTSDLVAYTNELAKIQEEIERIKGRMRFIDQNVAFSTIDIRVYETVNHKKTEDAKEPTLFGRASDAMKDSAHFVSELFQGLFVFLAGATPVIATAAVIGMPVWLVLRMLHRRRERMCWETGTKSEERKEGGEDPKGEKAEEEHHTEDSREN